MLRPMIRLAACLPWLTAATLVASSPALAGEPAHGLAIIGDLKYPSDFTHFDYVDPDAPKGGHVRLWYNGSYDNLNPFILKGRQAIGSNPLGVMSVGKPALLLTFQRLMETANDEAGSYYGLIAESVVIADDRRSIQFNLNPAARWHDGSEITAEDVAFSFDTLKADGHPVYRALLKDIERASVLGPRQIRFDFAADALLRDLPAIVADLPVISKAYYETRPFNETTLEPPLGSGPYRVDRVDEGRSISYRRVENHWAQDLPVNRGRWNFDRVTWDYFRDRDIALEALFAGKVDFRQDFTSRNWATKYDGVPAVQDGRLLKEVLPDGQPSGFQAFFINTRRDKFSDRRVRRAIGLVFDFEWTNRNLFYSIYSRTYSIFQNSDMEAHGKPSEGELALLEPWRDDLPPEVFGPPYRAPVTNGSGNIRQQLREAKRLLSEAGWNVRNGKLVNQAGEPFTIEFLTYSRLFERIIMPYVRNLERLGIEASFRLVEPAQYQRRMQDFDFDMTTFRFSQSLVPGVALRNWWSSSVADVPGGRNYTGLKSPVVDALLDKVTNARTRPELVTATAALDRVVMWTHNLVPQWNKASHNIAYWDMFGRPAKKPPYDLGFLDTWWLDRDKARALGRGD